MTRFPGAQHAVAMLSVRLRNAERQPPLPLPSVNFVLLIIAGFLLALLYVSPSLINNEPYYEKPSNM